MAKDREQYTVRVSYVNTTNMQSSVATYSLRSSSREDAERGAVTLCSAYFNRSQIGVCSSAVVGPRTI